MQANWSLILNVLLLMGVVVAITRMMKARRKNLQPVPKSPSVGQAERNNYDDIIAIRKVNLDAPAPAPAPVIQATTQPKMQPIAQPVMQPSTTPQEDKSPSLNGDESTTSLMMFLLAKENRQLAGYELLQTVLAAGLRFGDGQLFHRHQFPNGQGPVLCSLAAATASGVFDLQNIGAFVVRGLCLFMQASGNPTIDAERFEIMLDTAKQLSEGLDTYLLDDKRQQLTDASVERYHRMLNIDDVCEMA